MARVRTRTRSASFVFVLAIAGCAGAGRPPDAPTAISMSNPSIRDPSIRLDCGVLKPGVSRVQVEAALGAPDATLTLDNEETVALYGFFPDGSKFVNPGVGAGFFSHSASAAAESPSLEAVRRELAFYRIRYSLDGIVTAVAADRPLPKLRP